MNILHYTQVLAKEYFIKKGSDGKFSLLKVPLVVVINCS